MRADGYAQSLTCNDHESFWKAIRHDSNAKSTKFASTVAGCTGAKDITEMWSNHFRQLYNSVQDSADKEIFNERLASLSYCACCNITVQDIAEACVRQKLGKSVGNDGIPMEAFVHGGTRLYIHMSLLFSLFIKYSYVPSSLMKCIIVPLVKAKTGDLSDVNNYRAISVSTAVSKLFEHVLAKFLESTDPVDDYQFGFKTGHSTSLCTSALKQTIDYYSTRGSHVLTCFLDFSKAFDKVSYWKLFNMLLDDNCNSYVVKLLAYWYCHQEACVRWLNNYSEFFAIGNGTRQGGVLSPRLFARYIRDLLHEVVNSGVGCHLGGVMVNILAYADDIVLIAPSWRGLQYLINIVLSHISKIDMVANPAKSVCMLFAPKRRNLIVTGQFPPLQLGDEVLHYVSTFKYLGHRIANDITDDSDIQREVSNLFVRTNILIRRFCKCSHAVKLLLFKSFCLCMYDTALWKSYNIG